MEQYPPEAYDRAADLRYACYEYAKQYAVDIRVVPPHEIPDNANGCYTLEEKPMFRKILLNNQMNPVYGSIVLAHEIGHMADPGLANYAGKGAHLKHENISEAIAQFTALRLAECFGVAEYYPGGVQAMWDDIDMQYPLKHMYANDAMVHRSDRAVYGVLTLHPNGQALRNEIYAVRTREGRPESGFTASQRLSSRFRNWRKGHQPST